MRSIFFIIAFILVLVVLRLTLFSGNEAAKPSANGVKPAIPVKAIVASYENLEQTIPSTGSLLAFEDVNLMPEMAGKITSLNINEGKRVTKGELLVKLNDQELQASLKKTEANITLQQDVLKRQNELLKIQGVSQEERDKTQQSLDAAIADAEYYRALINKTELRAPFSGVLGLRNVSEGAFVGNNTNICSLFKIDELKLDFSLPERYIASLKLPLEVQFTVQGSEKTYLANVFAIQPAVEENTRTVRLRASVENTSGELMPGRFANVIVPLVNNDQAIMVPTQCIVPVLKGQQVWVSRNGLAQAQKVEVGCRTEKLVEVTSGLAPGDTIITSGIMSLRPGASLKITSLETTNAGK